MRVRDLALETHESLSAKKGRSFLTILGIVIGIMAVVVMVSLITGFSGWLEENMGLGSARVVTVSADDDQHALQYDDAAFLEENGDGVFESVIVQAQTSYTVDSQASSEDTGLTSLLGGSSASSTADSGVSLQVVGVDAVYFDMESLELASGSLYADDEMDQIVLDEEAVDNIFGEGANVVGRSITLGGDSYEIVGVVEAQSASMFGISIAYVPYAAASERMIGEQRVDELLALTAQGEDVTEAAARAEGLLAARHNVEYSDGVQDVYTASTTASALESLENYTLTFDALAALVAGIALLVGGIGIMNMMLTNVSERYREIGLRKSLGARPLDITLQFLSESVALCLTGGVIGIVAGYAGAWGLVAVLGRLNDDFAGLVPVISPALVAVVFAVCVCIGVVFGFYPARRAAKLDPAETLRYQ